ncbi:DNA mismatch repair protein MSH3 [Flagelloscypha sp. PMI_526]|nr:DNA mismatch repair protein MSH3 [Flagelloscypha sp. PMI_526]
MPAQATISAFFTPSPRKQKRSSSPVDLTISDDEAPKPKRRRLSPGLRDQTCPLSPAQAKRRKDFERKLLFNDNNPLLKRRSHLEYTASPSPDLDEALSDDEQEHESVFERFSNIPSSSKPHARTRLPQANSETVKLTPLEEQVLKLKEDNPGTLIMFQVGYKYQFYEEDARIASKELGIVCHPNGHNLNIASIPTHRRDVHLQKLLSCGHRVGICDQSETAALKKAGDKRNTLFERQINNLYTAATYIHSLEDTELEHVSPPVLLSVVERENNNIGKMCVSIGLVSIIPSTGEVSWDVFDDDPMRLQLETRLSHLCSSALAEIIYDVGKITEKLLRQCAKRQKLLRLEPRTESLGNTAAFSFVTDFISSRSKENATLRKALTALDDACYPPLAHLIKYLDAFGIAGTLLDARFFKHFQTVTHMLLASNTLQNLHVICNDEGGKTGSLLSLLDETKTKFGSRLLKNWLTRPLVDRNLLSERVNAVTEIIESTCDGIPLLQQSLVRCPDLARGLSRILYAQTSPQEFSVLLEAFDKIANIWSGRNHSYFESSILVGIVESLVPLCDAVEALKSEFDIQEGKQSHMDLLWKDPTRVPEITELRNNMDAVKANLQAELKQIRKVLKVPSLQYSTFQDDQYIVEFNRELQKNAPPTWTLLSKTKRLVRYRPPEKRSMQATCKSAWRSFLAQVTADYHHILRDVVNNLAKADCLISMAQVSLRENYVRPEFTEEYVLELQDGRHPVQEAYRDDPQIPNSIKLGDGRGKLKVLTGPNMGGKSSFVRMVAVLCLMAQCGCYVPATAFKMKPLDKILTRMGASDDILRGKSTFAVEMEETSSILADATSSSLVILDELGRGTSTHDGVAIAEASLEYLATKTKPFTFFITHYPSLTKLESKHPGDIQNLHMSYRHEPQIDGSVDITFLYRLTPGIAEASFGIECARLADIPDSILQQARTKAESLNKIVTHRTGNRRTERLVVAIAQLLKDPSLANLDKIRNMQDYIY